MIYSIYFLFDIAVPTCLYLIGYQTQFCVEFVERVLLGVSITCYADDVLS